MGNLVVRIKLPYATSTEHNALDGLYCDAAKKARSQEVVKLDDGRTNCRTITPRLQILVCGFGQQNHFCLGLREIVLLVPV